MTALIERLERAVGPSNELDAAIALACGWTAPREPGVCGSGYVGRDDYEWHDDEGGARGFDPPRLTASLDAAVALVERMGEDPTMLLPEAIDEMCRTGYRSDAPLTPQIARATVLALLRSMESRDA